MFYLELLENQMQKKLLKDRLKEGFRDSAHITTTLSEFENSYLKALEKRIDALSTCSDEQLPKDYIQIKRDLFEMHLWQETFQEALEEMVSSVTLNALRMRLQTNIALLERLFTQLTSYEEKVLQLREEKIFIHRKTQIQKALQKIKVLLQEASKKKNLDSQKIAQLLEDQETFFRYIADFFQERIPDWEKTVVSNGRSLLFSDAKRFPFSAVYTLQGNLYILLEIVGHFIGFGGWKIGCQAVNLSTSEVFALIQSRTEFPEAGDAEEEQKNVETSFYSAVKESKTLEHFLHQQGIIQLRDRFAFEVAGKKQIYLLEDYFADGSLEKHLAIHSPSSLTFKQKVGIALQIITGVCNIFHKGYVHGDIKPANILIDLHRLSIPVAAITDFNIAFLIAQVDSAFLLSNSPIWCPPEMASILLSEDRTSEDKERLIQWLPYRDVWNLGLILYAMFFEASLPWEKEPSPEKIFMAIAQLKHHWIPKRFQGSPFYTLITHMTAIHPPHRPTPPQALDEFLKEVQQLAIAS